tara:strand:+ start:4089 stop:4835 length:747 start_codon:yes stop_codon:yes gene_type:complete
MIKTFIYKNLNEGSIIVAKKISNLIKKKEKLNQKCVLGLSTGSSPLKTYSELIKMHKKEGLSFKNVIVFNLDEFYPMKPNSQFSYHSFMFNKFLKYIDIQKKNINIPKGDISNKKIKSYCKSFEKKIDNLGGIDLQLLGIGTNGHIGFNEPGSDINSITRKIIISNHSRLALSKDFKSIDNVPKNAITMGVKTILKAKKIILIAWGKTKSKIIRKTLKEKTNPLIPASYLQSHKNTLFILDNNSSSYL